MKAGMHVVESRQCLARVLPDGIAIIEAGVGAEHYQQFWSDITAGFLELASTGRAA